MQDAVLNLLHNARHAARALAGAGADLKNHALTAMADALEDNCEPVLAANDADVQEAAARQIPEAMLERMKLSPARVTAMAQGLRDVAALPDPVGRLLSGSIRPNGLHVERICVPLGVIGIIYESRPNVTSDAAALCLKAGNAVVLRGGSETLRSNLAIARVLQSAGRDAGLHEHAVQMIETTDRAAVETLMGAEGMVDLLIPRGGEGLKKAILAGAKVPVLASAGGNCHTYIDAGADIEMAAAIAVNAKVSRPSVCNAMETLLVHEHAANALFPILARRLKDAGVEVRACPRSMGWLPSARQAEAEDWSTEFLSLTLAVRTVASIDEAIAHISEYGTGHSEAIVTESYASAQRFIQEVDAACVFVNASTRFTDGAEFGMGAEVGISTQKLHARGPVGVEELTTYKTIIRGSGQIRT